MTTAGTPTVQETGDLDEEGELDEIDRPRPTNYFSIPRATERPVEIVGLLEPGNNGLGPQAFGRTNGAFLATLARRIDAPLPSRWTSILLRRALLSRIAAPPGVDPVDWVAARAACSCGWARPMRRECSSSRSIRKGIRRG